MLCARRILSSSGGYGHVRYLNNNQTESDTTHCCSNALSDFSPTSAVLKALLSYCRSILPLSLQDYAVFKLAREVLPPQLQE